MPSAFDDRERDAIRARLVGAALDALRRGGMAASSVADLASAASIAKGSFYGFYASKEELFMEALESIEGAYRAIFEAAAEGDEPPAERLRKAFRAAFDRIRDDPAVRSMDASMMDRLVRALPAERVERHIAHDAAEMARISAIWRTAGLLRADAGDDELAGAGYAVFGVSMSLANLPEALRQSTVDVVVRGLALALTEGVGVVSRERREKR